MSCSDCETFTITGTTYTVTLYKPLWNSEDNKINKNIDRFDLWDNDYEVVDKGINEDDIELSGIEMICDEFAICFPICFPLCFANDVIFSKFIRISNMMKDHEEITINGLGDNIDGIYVISNFRYRSMNKPATYEWSMSLAFVRDV